MLKTFQFLAIVFHSSSRNWKGLFQEFGERMQEISENDADM